MKFSLDFSAVHLSYALCFIAFYCAAHPADTIRELLSCSGWIELAYPNDSLHIIERRGDTENRLSVNQMLATRVTEANADDKIRQAHHFLSCAYARVLMELCDYEVGIGPQCRKTGADAISFKRLEDYAQVIRNKHPVVSRMTGALSCLQHLSYTQTEFRREVYDILVNLQNYYKHKTVARPAGDHDRTIRQTVNEESLDIEKHAHHVSSQLLAFYNAFCTPIPELYRGKLKATHNVRVIVELAEVVDDFDVFNNIETELEKIIKQFTESYDNTSGFEHDPERNTTRIIPYDPNTAERVAKMNQLLANDKWMRLVTIDIKEHGSPYVTQVEDVLKTTDGPDGTTIVTKENVYAKLKQVYLILSCQYSSILKECCNHVTAMWTHCQHGQDSVCLGKFLQILKENDKSVVRMIDALTFFHKLSPDTVYNNGVFNSLTSFKSSYDDRTAQDYENLKSRCTAIITGISEIEETLPQFYEKFCYPDDSFDICMVRHKGTIDDKGNIFKKSISQKTTSFAVFSSRNIPNIFHTL